VTVFFTHEETKHLAGQLLSVTGEDFMREAGMDGLFVHSLLIVLLSQGCARVGILSEAVVLLFCG
jgi:hypothetical protein